MSEEIRLDSITPGGSYILWFTPRRGFSLRIAGALSSLNANIVACPVLEIGQTQIQDISKLPFFTGLNGL